MKKLLTIPALFAATALYAQNDHYVWYREEGTFRAIAVLTVLGMFIYFILTFLKNILDHRIKNRIIEKGIPDHLASSLLQTTPKDNNQQTIKWFCLLAAIGAGLLIVYYTMPLDIHSLAIMAFSMSAGYMAYYFLTRQPGK